MSNELACYTLVGLSADSKQYTEQKIKDDLQSENISLKTEALKEAIRLMTNGEKFNNLLMTVIRFVMPSQDHTLKKLLHLFWEVVPKYAVDGKLLHEMILVCDAYRRDLQHPNEYIRGCTLRFLCKLKEAELLEPLMPAIQQCLDHRHAYVRRNAVLAIFTIYKNFNFLIPDAPERILQFLEQEQDASCKRNAFMMLLHASQCSALSYLATCLDDVQNFGDIMQLVIVELIYKVCHADPTERSRFIRCIYSLLHSSSAAVRYEAAGTLLTLSNAPAAIRAVANCYIDLILKESDNNAKLVIMDRLVALRQQHERILQELVMDVVRILGASDMELRLKALELTVDLVTMRTADDLVSLLRKELVKACSTINSGGKAVETTEPDSSGNGGSYDVTKTVTTEDDIYRFSLVHTIYEISMRFSHTLPKVIPTVCDILAYEDMGDSKAAIEVCRFVREAIQRCPQNKPLILEKLIHVFTMISGKETLRNILWIFGEFSVTLEEISAFVTLVRQTIGPLPLVQNETNRLMAETCPTDDANVEDTSSALLAKDGGLSLAKPAASSRVTADGTYATESALTSGMAGLSGMKQSVKRPVIQAALFESAFMTGVVLSTCLVKVFCRYMAATEQQLTTDPESQKNISHKKNSFAAECMFIISSMIHLARSPFPAHQVNPDHIDRMWTCLLALSDPRPAVMNIFDVACRNRLTEMLTAQETGRRQRKRAANLSSNAAEIGKRASQADAPIKFSLLSGASDLGDMVNQFDFTLSQALGGAAKAGDAYATSKLRKVHQLTGFSDPVYAEAYVHVNQYDIVLDVLVVNQTSDTLQNLTLELSTLGDLKLVEKPRPLTMASQDFANIKANIKVSSTENGIIFGNIVYDVKGSAGECTCIVLADIHIDILEYILPSTCTNSEYRQMWSEFEWENKVTVNTQINDLQSYLSYITSHTNMRCLTPPEALRGDCSYLCATLYARSIFGEHVLANLCLEKLADDQPVTGHVRIRAKTQGMAVTMGEKVSTSQKLWSSCVAPTSAVSKDVSVDSDLKSQVERGVVSAMS